MRKLVTGAALAVLLATAAAPLASADSSAWRLRMMDCGSAGTIDFLLPPSEFLTAFVPVHEAHGTGVLTILQVNVDHTVYISKPLATRAGDRLVSCAYIDPRGLHVVLTGILTPGL